jgi:hypothetical protein
MPRVHVMRRDDGSYRLTVRWSDAGRPRVAKVDFRDKDAVNQYLDRGPVETPPADPASVGIEGTLAYRP